MPPSSSLLSSAPDVPPWTTHPAEIELLLTCARPDVSEDVDRIRTLAAADLDWSFVVETSTRHGLDAMLYHHLHQIAPEAVPKTAFRTLRDQSAPLLASNLYRLGVLLQLVESFRAHDLPVLSFKGPLLAQQYYGNLGFRDFVDVDILVPRAALPQARAVLAENDFVPAYARSAEEEARVVDAQLGLEFVRPRDGVWIELHWALLNDTFAFRLDPDALWARSVLHPVGTRTIPGLAPEDLLLYLCAHGTKHHWAALKHICDVAQVCRTVSLDWSVLLNRAEAIDADRMLFLGLLLATRWLDAPLPPAVRARLPADPIVPQLARHVETNWLFSDDGFDRTPRWAQLQFFLRSRRRWRSRLPLLLEYAKLALTPTDKDTAFFSLPAGLSGLHYVLRPLRLLLNALQRALMPSPPAPDDAP